MPTFTFANGQQLASTSFTPNDFHLLAQSIVAQILGYDPTQPDTDDADKAYSKVRVGWQQEGQPAWKICQDVCILRAVLENEPFAKTRDELYEDPYEDPAEFSRHMGYTQVWRLYLVFYGPNSDAHARLVLSAMVLDWVRELFGAWHIYVVPDWEPPSHAPELFQGQWWDRTDVEIRFNELAEETTVVPEAEGVDVAVIKENGLLGPGPTAQAELRRTAVSGPVPIPGDKSMDDVINMDNVTDMDTLEEV